LSKKEKGFQSLKNQGKEKEPLKGKKGGDSWAGTETGPMKEREIRKKESQHKERK